MIWRYEQQEEPEARFVRALDKILPKFVHAHNGSADLLEVVTESLQHLVLQIAEVDLHLVHGAASMLALVE